MAAPGGMEDAAVVQPGLERLLRTNPTAVEFFQAVRLLERLHPERTPVGTSGDPQAEVVHFAVPPSAAFPASEIQGLDWDDGGPVRMAVNFMGLTGPLGVLPLTYTLRVAERERYHDHAFRDFLDLFHHRLISLFYRAWEKYRFVIAYERDRQDRLTAHLLDLVGLGGPALRDRLPLPDEALVFYAGLLALRSRPAAALRQLLEDYFDVPVEVEQFVGGWYSLAEETQCHLDEDGMDPSGQLGLGAVVGDALWDQQSKVRLRLGPLTRQQYDSFLPTGGAYRPLRAITRFYAGEQFEFEIQLVLAREDVPWCTLAVDESAPPLGWSTWLGASRPGRDPDDTVLALSGPAAEAYL
jgi:type VI secretion system protein ImpH